MTATQRWLIGLAVTVAMAAVAWGFHMGSRMSVVETQVTSIDRNVTRLVGVFFPEQRPSVAVTP